jgi:hypothetical protein
MHMWLYIRVKVEHQRLARLLHPLNGTRMEMGGNWYGFHCRVDSHPRKAMIPYG